MNRLFGGRREGRESAIETHLLSNRNLRSIQTGPGLPHENQVYALALRRNGDADPSGEETSDYWDVLSEEMALIPSGLVRVMQCGGHLEAQQIEAFYLDRHCVTNLQFLHFVQAGCYDVLELWPQEIWPSLLKFTDQTGKPGPAGWQQGTFPANRADHPVVGVSWYEASAYAEWLGKRLPTAGEWQKAAGWPDQLSDGHCSRYPWGEIFDPSRANILASGIGSTAAVSSFPNGDTPNGIRQLIGNVWEWLIDPLVAIPGQPGETFETWRYMRRIVGGAFDTYLSSEATSQFVTGQPELDRRANIGFRCAISADALMARPEP